MAGPTSLDELDVKILRLLNADARKSYRDIAKATDASISTVSSRVRKLEDLGVITGYVPVLNEARLGYDVLAVVGVKIHKGKLLEVQRRIAKDDRVTHVYDVTGEWDSIVVVRLKNTRELDAFIKLLGWMDYVENTYTQVVLNVVKEERRVLVYIRRQDLEVHHDDVFHGAHALERQDEAALGVRLHAFHRHVLGGQHEDVGQFPALRVHDEVLDRPQDLAVVRHHGLAPKLGGKLLHPITRIGEGPPRHRHEGIPSLCLTDI